MGRQISFYMLPDDEVRFLEGIERFGEPVLLAVRATSPSPVVLERLPQQGTVEARSGVVLARKPLGLIVMKKLAEESFVLNKDNSEVVEFHQSEVRDGMLLRGRLWMEPAGHDENFDPVPKSKEYVDWYGRIAGWIRKNYQRTAAGFYVAPHAAAWVAGGGKLR
jgi:hypothetical protein